MEPTKPGVDPKAKKAKDTKEDRDRDLTQWLINATLVMACLALAVYSFFQVADGRPPAQFLGLVADPTPTLTATRTTIITPVLATPTPAPTLPAMTVGIVKDSENFSPCWDITWGETCYEFRLYWQANRPGLTDNTTFKIQILESSDTERPQLSYREIGMPRYIQVPTWSKEAIVYISWEGPWYQELDVQRLRIDIPPTPKPEPEYRIENLRITETYIRDCTDGTGRLCAVYHFGGRAEGVEFYHSDRLITTVRRGSHLVGYEENNRADGILPAIEIWLDDENHWVSVTVEWLSDSGYPQDHRNLGNIKLPTIAEARELQTQQKEGQ